MASEAADPLLPEAGSRTGDGPATRVSEDLELAPDSPTRRGNGLPNVFLWLLSFSAGLGGLLFGYDTGVISATLVSIGNDLSSRPLTALDKSLITSVTALFALLASPLASPLADSLGRRRVILVADVLFAFGALLQSISATVAVMMAGRAVVGLAVGASSFVVPLYVAELAPAAHRGRLVTANVLMITLGQVVAYIVGWALSTAAGGWRIMVGLGAAPALLQLAAVLAMPETPRWLVMKGKSSEARAVIIATTVRQVASPGEANIEDREATAVLRAIEHEVEAEEDMHRQRSRGASRLFCGVPFGELFSDGRNRRALAIACLLQGLQQLCGFNSLMYFSATIFQSIGFRSPTLTALVVAGTNFAFTVAALVLVDRIGRRRILLASLPFMVMGLLLAAGGFGAMDLRPGDLNDASVDTSNDSEPEGRPGAAVVILVSIVLYVAAYAIGLGNVPWMQSELFPLRVRSMGSGLATATNWTANFVVGLTFLPFMELLSPSWTFVLYAAVCAGGLGLIYRIYPETAGLSLEDAGKLLDDGWGVR